MALTPHDFAMKWQAATTTERASAQTHFNDLCSMVGVKAPLEADPTGKTAMRCKARPAGQLSIPRLAGPR